MSCDGLFLHQIHKQINKYLPAKINKVYLISDTELLLHCRGDGVNFKLIISAHPQFARMNITQRSYPTPETPANFTMLLRKHIENGIILSFEQIELDRVFFFTVSVQNDFGDRVKNRLYVELMGKYANVILCDESNKIIDCLKRVPPYENSRRTLWPGAQYIEVPRLPKADPRVNFQVDPNESLVKQFQGFSPLLATEAEYRMKQGQAFSSIMEEITNSSNMYITKLNNDAFEYHCIPLTHLNLPYTTHEIMEGFDYLYYSKEERDRIRQQTGDLFRFVRKELDRNRSKLIKLQHTLDEAFDCDKYRIYGELLYAYSHQVVKGMDSITLPDFTTSEPVCIPLDKKFDGKYNAKKMYQKYTKGKNAQIIVKEQIDKCVNEITYFELIEAQLEQANFNDAKEIRMELASKGYMKQLVSKVRRKKQLIPSFSIYTVEDTQIYVGKNNLQNDYITWKASHKSDIWLHVKDMHGSHVVIQNDAPSETVLRAAANLAAYFSKGRSSSSVPVNYCPIRNLKKIPNSPAGLVQLSNYKTIYIDPDEEAISSYKYK